MKIHFEHTLADYSGATKQVGRHLISKIGLLWLSKLMGGIFGASLIFGIISIATFYDKNPCIGFYELNFGLLSIALGITTTIAIFLILQSMIKKKFFNENGPYLSTYTLEVIGESLTVHQGSTFHSYPLNIILEVVSVTGFILVFIDNGVAIYIPDRAFCDTQEREAFISLINR